MIDSLFGMLAPMRLPDGGAAPAGVGLREDVVVDGSVVQALRQSLAAQRASRPPADGLADDPAFAHSVTLLDPSGEAAGPLMHHLAQATGCPVQQMHVRDRATLRTLAVVARGTVPRPGQPPLQVFCTQVREPGMLPLEMAYALAEDADLTLVLAGHLPRGALAALLTTLLAASHRPGWRCPHLVVVLPPCPGDDGTLARWQSAAWPKALQLRVLQHRPGDDIQLWNATMLAWQAMRQSQASPSRGGQPVDALGPQALAPGPQRRAWPELASDVWPQPPRPASANSAGAAGAASTGAPPPSAADSPGDAVSAADWLDTLGRTDGLLACAVVDMQWGTLLATRHRDGQAQTDLAGLAQALCSARRAHLAVSGDAPSPDEVLITSGGRQALLRRLPGPRQLGFLAQLDRHQANLPLLRFRLLEAERALA